MAKKASVKKSDGPKKTALIRIGEAVLFIAFDEKKVSGTVTGASGTTQSFDCELKEVD